DVARTVWPDATAEATLAAIDVGAAAPNAEGFWTLDPIDGTKGFIRGQQYAVCLAYIERGEVVIGVLGCPNLPRDSAAALDRADPIGCLYVAERGGGARRHPDGARINCADWRPGEPVRMCESFEGAHSDQSATGRILARLGPAGAPARLDS